MGKKQEEKKSGKTEFGGPLYRKLKAYGDSDYYAFHMPGHKRKLGVFENPYQIDITEINGFDDLHHPEEGGILVQAEERAARVYGAEETHFLVNGSTAGILSAVSGCTRRGGKLLMARNCHRSVYHAAELRELYPVYLYPQQIEALGINGAILPEDVENALKSEEEIQAVMITSPTYDGVCSDVRRIAEICHEFGKPLLVDQAHGAHFPFSEYFPEDALRAGADIVIHSVHKTLPSITQTALLHMQGGLADRERVRRYLSVYQSSSPSYVLMASIDACMELLEREGERLFAKHEQELTAFRESCQKLQVLYLAGADSEENSVWQESRKQEEFGRETDFDRSKLLISARRAGISGSRISELLRERYHLQMEMSGPDYVVAIAGIADTREGFERLEKALSELDQELAEEQGYTERRKPESKGAGGYRLPRLPLRLTPGEAGERDTELCTLAAGVNRIAGSYVYLYPPGIPVLAPGEQVTEALLEQVGSWLAAGYTVHGLETDAKGKKLLKVLAVQKTGRAE